MAPSSGIPTSFVPKAPVRTGGKYSSSGGNIFLVASVGLLALSLFLAAGVFAYKYYLTGVRDGKQEAVEKAEQAVDRAAVEEFIRTRDRFLAAQALLDGHVATSRFFALLERVTLANVRFNTLTLTLAEDGSAVILMEGVARTFNALAAQSSALAEEREVKRAIFSDIAVDDESNVVTFSLSAQLAPSLLAFGLGENNVPPPQVETSPVETQEVPEETPPTTPL